MNISFVVITNGKKINKTTLVLKSIFYQKVPEYEILLCGRYYIDSLPERLKDKINYIKKPKAATDGLLGVMRNSGCSQAKHDVIVILDDDMILSKDWYKNLLKYGPDFDVLTSKILLPEGTRFWDHACYMSPKYGHVILEETENDDYLYMSGGQAWVMKKYVFEKAKWNVEMSTGKRANMKNVEEYHAGKHNEDTDFSEKVRSFGFAIKHNHQMLAFHNDAIYTCVGRICNPRQNGRTYEWVKSIDMYRLPEEIVTEAKEWYKQGYLGECADILRYALLFHFNNAFLQNELDSLEKAYGGKLSDNNWNIDGDPQYNKEIEFYKKYDYS